MKTVNTLTQNGPLAKVHDKVKQGIYINLYTNILYQPLTYLCSKDSEYIKNCEQL